MTGLGTLFQEARLKQGLTIEEVAERTKIRTQFLIAIEEGRFNELPDQAYVRAFLRTYARALDLKPEAIMLEYEARHAPLQQGEALGIRERRLKIRSQKRLRFAVGVGILAIIGVLAYLLHRLLVL